MLLFRVKIIETNSRNAFREIIHNIIYHCATLYYGGCSEFEAARISGLSGLWPAQSVAR
jgi:hypothetical protein